MYWSVKGKTEAQEVGMEVEKGLAVEWRRIKD